MTDIWNELRPKLEFFSRPFPHEAVALACLHREEVAPRLIAALEAIADNPEPARDGDYMLHFFAMHLLAAWRDSRAYRPLARLGHEPEAVLDDLFGDVLNESYGRCLASTCDGDLTPIKALVEDLSAVIWVRWAAWTALGARVLEGDDDREGLIAYLLEQGGREAAQVREDPDYDPEILHAIVSTACDVGAVPMLETIREWFAEELADRQFAGLQSVEEEITRPFAECQAEMRRRKGGYVVEVAREMEWFAGYGDAPEEIEDDGEDWLPPQETYIRAAPKTGRNDPCPCGSGKKYKKCHGASA